MSSARVRALLAALTALAAVLLAVPAGASGAPAPQRGTSSGSTPSVLPEGGYAGDFPDPHVLRVGEVYYAYSTTTGGRHLPVLRSTDLRTWTGVRPEVPVLGDALPRPAWWSADRDGGLAKETWAPSVIEVGGRFVAYYAVRVAAPQDRFCISMATSASPEGPFVDATVAPLVCDADPNGSIDPFPFRDPRDGRVYLLWKAEGVPGRTPQRLMVRELDPDGLAFRIGSAPRELLRPTRSWEDGVVENPAMVLHGGVLRLFYSGHRWDSASYAEGVATCRTPLGPCGKRPTPLMTSQGSRLGRAGGSPFVDAAGRLRLAYHWWQAPQTSYTAGGQRRMSVATVTATARGLRVTG